MTDTPSSHKPPIDHRDIKSIPARSPYPPPYNDAFHPDMQWKMMGAMRLVPCGCTGAARLTADQQTRLFVPQRFDGIEAGGPLGRHVAEHQSDQG